MPSCTSVFIPMLYLDINSEWRLKTKKTFYVSSLPTCFQETEFFFSDGKVSFNQILLSRIQLYARHYKRNNLNKHAGTRVETGVFDVLEFR